MSQTYGNLGKTLQTEYDAEVVKAVNGVAKYFAVKPPSFVILITSDDLTSIRFKVRDADDARVLAGHLKRAEKMVREFADEIDPPAEPKYVDPFPGGVHGQDVQRPE